MRVIVETQSRARTRARIRVKRLFLRFFEALAGVPLAPRGGAVTFRRVSPVRQAVQSVMPAPLRDNRQAREMVVGLFFGSIHAVFALANIVVGLLTRSLWILSVGIVVAALNTGKSYMASGALMSVVGASEREAVDSIHRCCRAGIALLIMMLVMSQTVERIVLQGFGEGYPGILMYAYAAYAFALITASLVNLVRARREETLAVKGVRAFNLANALISIFALQAVLLSRVDWASLPAWVSRDAVEGAVVGAVILSLVGIGLWLVAASTTSLASRQGRGVRVRKRRRKARHQKRRRERRGGRSMGADAQSSGSTTRRPDARPG